MHTYVARSKHKNGCHLCDEPILVGDEVTTWPWVNPDGPGGNIMRVHSTCYDVEQRSPREEFSPGSWGEEQAEEAASRLVVARADPVSEEELIAFAAAATDGQCARPSDFTPHSYERSIALHGIRQIRRLEAALAGPRRQRDGSPG